MVPETTECPGCGVRLPTSGLPPDPRSHASPECWQVHGEVVGFELVNAARLGRLHQLTVDAYGAQHAAGDGLDIRTGYSLVGLCLALERGWDGVRVRNLHQRMGRRDPSWPDLEPPADRGAIKVLDVAEAGFRAGSVEGHQRAVQEWAVSVWTAWSERHDAVRTWCDRLTD